MACQTGHSSKIVRTLFKGMQKMERKYIVVAIIECPKMKNNGSKITLSDESRPMTHKEACTFMSKITKYKWRRVQLEDV